MANNTDIFAYDDYKKWVLSWIHAQPRDGYGQLSRIADHLETSSVVISQVFRGSRELNLEQGHLLSEFMGLSRLEQQYFLLLLQKARSGTRKYASYIEAQLNMLRERSRQIKHRVVASDILSELDKAIFHSSWVYSAIRLATSIEDFNTPTQIAQRFGLDKEQVHQIVEFLLSRGLCIRDGRGLRIGPQRTHLEQGSPFILSRQMSWRQKGFEKMASVKPTELFYTGPISVSREDLDKIRGELLNLIDRVNKIVDPSTPEEVACLNIDWFVV